MNKRQKEIESDSGGQKRDKNRYRWIDDYFDEVKKIGLKESDINLDLQRDIKKQKVIVVDRKEIKIDTCRQMRISMR